MPSLNIASIPDAFLWPGDFSKPIIVTLHGLGGDNTHFLDPTTIGVNYDYSGSPPPPPSAIRVGTFSTPPPSRTTYIPTPDSLKGVRAWKTFLNDENGFPVVTYSQTSPSGALAPAISELATLISGLNANPLVPVDARYVLLAHSRGGLLARSFIKANFTTPELVGRISKVITLCSPHRGSAWVGLLAGDAAALAAANAALASATPAVAAAITSVLAPLGPGIAALLAPPIAALSGSSPAAAALIATALAPVLRFLRGGAGRAQLAVGSPFITALENGEQPLPGVSYHTFGGTSTRVTRVWDWGYALTSWIPNLTVVPGVSGPTITTTFTWTVDAPWHDWLLSPVAKSLYDALPPNHRIPEITSGDGDLLVSDRRATLPFSSHHSLSISHPEALWDPTLQGRVLGLLDEGTWGAWGVFPGADFRKDALLARDEFDRLALFAYNDTVIRQKREIATGDTAPSSTASPGPGGAHGWTDWVDLPEPFPRPVAAAFDAMSDNGVAIPGRLHLFGLAGDRVQTSEGGRQWDTLDVSTRFRATGPDHWWSWQTLGGTDWNSRPDPPYSANYVYVESTLSAGPVVVRNAQGQLEIFAVGGSPDGNQKEIRHLRQLLPRDPSDWNHWGEWTSLGLSCAGDFTAGINALGQVELYLQDSDGVVRLYRRLAPDREWQQWSFAAEAVAGSLAVETDGAGMTWVFALGSDGLLRRTRPKAGLGAQFTSSGVRPSLVSAAAKAYARFDISPTAAENLADALGGTSRIRGRGLWTEWTPAPGRVGAGGFSVARNQDGRLEVFARSDDGHIMHMVQGTIGPTSVTWSPWLLLGGVARSRPVAGIRADGKLVVVVLGEDGLLRQRVQQSSGTW